MRLLAAYAAIIALVLLFSGCAAEGRDAGTNGQAAGYKQPNITETQKGEPPRNPVYKISDMPGEKPQAGNETAMPGPPKNAAPGDAAAGNAGPGTQKETRVSPEGTFIDNEYGIEFQIPSGTQLIRQACKYWGAGQNCIAVILWNGTKREMAEYGAELVDGKTTAREYLEKLKLINRTGQEMWYEATFANRKAYVMEIENETAFWKRIYAPIAGKLVYFESHAKEPGEIAAAKAAWESLRGGGAGIKDYYPLDFPCQTLDSGCKQGEICYARASCTGINSSDTALRNYFNSSLVCTSGGISVCRKTCSIDSDCPKGQQCFTLTNRYGYKTEILDICA